MRDELTCASSNSAINKTIVGVSRDAAAFTNIFACFRNTSSCVFAGGLRYAMRALIVTCISLSFIVISGCSTPQAPNTVYVQVPTPCVKKEDVPIVPTVLPNAELAKLDDYALVITIATERLALAQYAKEANALISACVK